MKMLLTMSTAAVVAASVSPALAADAVSPPTTSVVAPAPAPAPARLPMFGLLADAGLPDGMNAALVVRPWKWVRVQGGMGSNTMSTGFRGGLTLLPFGWGPSLSVEAGKYKPGNANELAQKIVGSSYESQAFLERVGYSYVNGHVGLDFGSRRFVFFIHGGVTKINATLSDDGQGSTMVGSSGSSGDKKSGMEVAVSGTSSIRAIGPSVKMGLILFLL